MFTVFVASIAALLAKIFAQGFTLMVLWSWFIPALFEAMPELSFPYAAGTVLVIQAVTGGGERLSLSWTVSRDDLFTTRKYTADPGVFIECALCIALGSIVRTFI